MAIDLNIHDHKGTYLTSGSIYTLAGHYWESLDARNRWGSNFSSGIKGDIDHFEMHDVPIHRIITIKHKD